MRPLRRAAVLALAAALAGGAAVPAAAAPPLAKKKSLERIPLVWKPTTKLSEQEPLRLEGVEGLKIRLVRLADQRENPSLIGENREEEAEGRILPVTTADDVSTFVTDRMKSLLSSQGLRMVEEGEDVRLEGELRKFFVVERNRYEAEITVRMKLLDRAGETLWMGTTSGGSSRFGRSYKADNYYEVLSDALIETVWSVLGTDSFQEALARGRGGAAAGR